MVTLQNYKIIPEKLWYEIIGALESASMCDHDEVEKVLDTIDDLVKGG